MNLVSIIVPYYKKKSFIRKSIKSILKQSYKNFEIIIIYDDPSFEDLSYIKNIMKLDKRISLLINKKNIGAGQSRNNAIKKAKGKFIAFLDADDIWKKNKLKLQLKFMKNNKYKISHTSYQILDKQNKISGNRIAKKFVYVEDLLKSCDIGLSTVILEKKIFSRLCKFGTTKTKEDFILWLAILKKKIIIGSFDKDLTLWRRTKDSLSSSIIQKIIDGFIVYNKHMKFNYFKSFYYLALLSFNYIKK
jgi:teichuronic acid biosynthesis glycosyltransferase TuaG